MATKSLQAFMETTPWVVWSVKMKVENGMWRQLASGMTLTEANKLAESLRAEGKVVSVEGRREKW